MTARRWIGSAAVLGAVIAIGVGLALYKWAQIAAAMAGGPGYEPAEAITVVEATERNHRRSTTVIGTVRAIRSVELRNELAGTVKTARLTPGAIVEPGTVLVELDTTVEQADKRAHEAQAKLSDIVLERIRQMGQSNAVSTTEVDRAKTEREVATALVARDEAVIARKTILAPFRARIGMADLHPGQYLEEGTLLTTLQGVDEAAHIDFTVAQDVAAALSVGDTVDVVATSAAAGTAPTPAKVVAVDARVDRATRNASVRARVEAASSVAAPGASVRVKVPFGPPRTTVVVPASALRRGPGGDHVFVIAPDAEGKPRARVRPVKTGDLAGDEVLLADGLKAGERVAATGSFKLREAGLVAVVEPPKAPAPAAADAGR